MCMHKDIYIYTNAHTPADEEHPAAPWILAKLAETYLMEDPPRNGEAEALVSKVLGLRSEYACSYLFVYIFIYL